MVFLIASSKIIDHNILVINKEDLSIYQMDIQIHVAYVYVSMMSFDKQQYLPLDNQDTIINIFLSYVRIYLFILIICTLLNKLRPSLQCQARYLLLIINVSCCPYILPTNYFADFMYLFASTKNYLSRCYPIRQNKTRQSHVGVVHLCSEQHFYTRIRSIYT